MKALLLLALLTVPPRDLRNSLAGLPDEQMWGAIQRANGYATAGLRRSGSVRGIWNGHLLIEPAEVLALREPLSKLAIDVVAFDEVLPAVTVRLRDIQQLHLLRNLPYVDYVEPAASPVQRTSSTGGIGGCDLKPWPALFGMPQQIQPEGDYVPWNFYRHRIPMAWARATGTGIVVAWIDSGIVTGQPQLARVVTRYTFGDHQISNCGHGTLTGTTIVAPRDGANIVGVAYNATGMSIRSIGGVLVTQEDVTTHDSIRRGITLAAAEGAKVINMAFGVAGEPQLIADEIRRVYDAYDVLFVAAAGTLPDNVTNGPLPGVVFPARMGDQVIGVGGSDPSDPRKAHKSTLFGPEVDVTAVIDWQVPAAGDLPTYPSVFGGTSDASAVISGILALIWSGHRNWTRDQVQARLFASALPARALFTGWGPVDAYRAVGGFEGVWIDGPDSVQLSRSYTLTANAIGEGPFAYRWNTGETTPSITKRGRCTTLPPYRVTVTDLTERKQLTASWTVTVDGCGSQ